jgi:hydroxymethylbilane synthase
VSKKPSGQLLIKVGARSSPLSKKQVEEVYAAVKRFFSHVIFLPIYVETTGDLDRKTSLRALDKTDFFTREIDQLLLKNACRIAIHSAKDLPEPLPKGLAIAALTKGLDPSDSLVFREGSSLPKAGLIATSSERREASVRKLCPEARFVDIRGNIQERLDQLMQKKVDGVVIAEAALIRLGLTHLDRIKLPGETAPLQGRLAVVARKEDKEMHDLFNGLSAS